MNKRIATLKLRGAALVVCGGVMACVIPACSGDDTATEPPVDSGSDVTTTPDTGTITGNDAAPDVTTPPPDTGTDAPADRVVEASTQDAPGDAHPDVTLTTDAGDAGDAGDGSRAADATAEAEAAAPLAPLALCTVFDTDDTVAFDPANGGTPLGDPNQDAATRALAWGTDIALAFGIAATNDCRTSGLAQITPGAPDGTTGWLGQISRYTVALMGCGEDPEAGVVTYTNLILPNAPHVYTVADANILTELYLNAVLQAASNDWFNSYATYGTAPRPTPLTGDEFDQIQAAVNALQAADANLNPSSRQSSINTCANDAGAEGGGGSEAGTEGGATSGDAGADASND